MNRETLLVGLVVVGTVVGLGATPAAGAAAALGTPSVTPTTVDTGSETTLSLAVDVTDVDTSDGTTGASVTFDLSSAVDLSGATVSSVSVTPNATDVAASSDADAHTITVRWDDDGGVVDEDLTVEVTIDGAVAEQTGTTDVFASADADASGGVEVTSSAGQLVAAAPTSDRSITTTPGTLYLGEQDVDITGLPGASPAGTSQQFYGVGGEAEGTSAEATDALAVDVVASNLFVTGSYSLSAGSEDSDLVVVSPQVTDLTLYAGTSVADTDVTNQSVPRGTETLTLEPEFNFDDSEGVEISVEDDDGLDITSQVTTTSVVSTSGGTLAVDVADLPVGEYQVTAEGADDLDRASDTVSFEIRDREKAVTLSKTRVVRGERTVVSVAGAPGDIRYLRLSGDALRAGTLLNPATAREVFERTSQVQSVSADSDANYLYAVVALDSDGISEARIRTDRLRTESIDVELATEIDAAAEDEVTLDVRERTVTVDSVPATAVGETVTVSGTAPQSDQVKLYATVDQTYVPLYEDADGGTLAEPTVQGDGSWRVDVDTSAVVDIPGTYRLVAVGDPGSARLGSDTTLDADTFDELEPRGSTTLRTGDGALSLRTSRTTIAATGTDEFTLSGTAVGQEDDLRLYHIGPRGDVDARSVDVADGTFEEQVDGVDNRGVHTYLAVAAGRDGTYAYAPGDDPSVDSLLSGAETPEAARATLEDAYTGAGSDDRLERVTVTASDASLTVATPAEDAAVTGETLTVAGDSNREDETAVFVELRDGPDAVTVARTSVTNGTWTASVDLADLSVGTYQLVVETDSERLSRPVTVSETATATSATATETDSTTPTETVTATPTETVTATPMATASSSGTTSTEFPGLGVVSAVAALLAIVVGVARSRNGGG